MSKKLSLSVDIILVPNHLALPALPSRILLGCHFSFRVSVEFRYVQDSSSLMRQVDHRIITNSSLLPVDRNAHATNAYITEAKSTRAYFYNVKSPDTISARSPCADQKPHLSLLHHQNPACYHTRKLSIKTQPFLPLSSPSPIKAPACNLP